MGTIVGHLLGVKVHIATVNWSDFGLSGDFRQAVDF